MGKDDDDAREMIRDLKTKTANGGAGRVDDDVHDASVLRFAGYFGLTPRETFAINRPSETCAKVSPSNHPAMEMAGSERELMLKRSEGRKTTCPSD
jgi:hypothetical protein